MFKPGMVAVCIVVVVVLTACSREASYRDKPTTKDLADTRAIAKAIESRLEKGAPIRWRVACPTGMKWEAGKTFKCVVKGPDGRSQARVTLGEAGDDAGGPSSGSGRTVQGEYSWRLE